MLHHSKALLMALVLLTVSATLALAVPTEGGVATGDPSGQRRSTGQGPSSVAGLWATTFDGRYEFNGATSERMVLDSQGHVLLTVVDRAVADDPDDDTRGILAVDATDGTVAWFSETDAVGCTPVATDDGRIYAFGVTSTPARGVLEIDAADGAVLREWDAAAVNPGTTQCAGWMNQAGDTVVFQHSVSFDDRLTALDVSGTDITLAWDIYFDGWEGTGVYPPTISPDGQFVYTVHYNDFSRTTPYTLSVYDATTGAELSSLDVTAGGLFSSVVAVGDGLVVSARVGNFSTFTLTRYTHDSDGTGLTEGPRVQYDRDEADDDSGTLAWPGTLALADDDTIVAQGDSLIGIDLDTLLPEWVNEPEVSTPGFVDASGTTWHLGFNNGGVLRGTDPDGVEIVTSASGELLFGPAFAESRRQVTAVTPAGTIIAHDGGDSLNLVAYAQGDPPVEPTPTPTPTPTPDPGNQPGDPGTILIDGDTDGDPSTPSDAIDVANQICSFQVDDGLADEVALARVDEFADALAGSSLPSVACILFTDGGPDAFLNARTQAEIERALRPGGRVYLLGGPNALSARVEGTVASLGYETLRLQGPTRFETAEAVAREVELQLVGSGEGPVEVILGYGLNWPDVITAGAYARANGAVIALTDTTSLHPTAQRIISGIIPDRTYVVGGTAVINSTVEAQVLNAVRVAGPNRMGTAVAVAEQMWPRVPASGEDFVFANLDRGDGWTLALAAAPLSARIGGPQLGVRADSLPTETQVFLQNQGIPNPPSLVVLGDLSFVSGDVVTQIEGSAGTGR